MSQVLFLQAGSALLQNFAERVRSSEFKNAALSIGLHVVAYSAALLVLNVDLNALVLCIGVLLIWVSATDFRTWRIPDLASGLLAVFAAWKAAAALMQNQDWLDFTDRVLGGILWPSLFWLLARGYRNLRGIDGLGMGDVKLMIGIGILTGAAGTANVVLMAAISAILALGSGPIDFRVAA